MSISPYGKAYSEGNREYEVTIGGNVWGGGGGGGGELIVMTTPIIGLTTLFVQALSPGSRAPWFAKFQETGVSMGFE